MWCSLKLISHIWCYCTLCCIQDVSCVDRDEIDASIHALTEQGNLLKIMSLWKLSYNIHIKLPIVFMVCMWYILHPPHFWSHAGAGWSWDTARRQFVYQVLQYFDRTRRTHPLIGPRAYATRATLQHKLESLVLQGLVSTSIWIYLTFVYMWFFWIICLGLSLRLIIKYQPFRINMLCSTFLLSILETLNFYRSWSITCFMWFRGQRIGLNKVCRFWISFLGSAWRLSHWL